MEVIIRPTAEHASRLTAQIIHDAVRANPDIVLGLATGRSMLRVYAALVELGAGEGADYARVHTFNLDEYIGLAPDDPRSYHHYMNEHFFRHLNIDLAHTHIPDGTAEDFVAESSKYETSITDCGGIDLQVLGIGASGHIGFNEPLSAMRSRTREKALTPQTIEQNSQYFGGAEHVPKRAITMGVGTILDARRCVLLATGARKASIIAKAVEGPVTSMISATALQLHAKCTVIVDEDAAAELEQQDYYHWLFENEPEWEAYRNTPGL